MNKLLIPLILLLLIPLKVNAASLSLSPANLTLNVGEQKTLTVHLDPQSDSVIGTDIYLKYDPTKLKVISVVNLNVFPGLPSTIIQNDQGLTKFSLIQNYGIYQTVPADIASVTLEALNPASATLLSFDFTPGKTQDTNVAVVGGLDSLNLVSNSTLTIIGTVNPPDPTLTPTIAYASPTPTPTTRPKPTHQPQLTSPPLAPGFVSPLGKDLPSHKPTDIPKGGRILGTSSNPVNNRSPWYLFLSFTIAAFIVTVGAIIYLIKHPQSDSTYA